MAEEATLNSESKPPLAQPGVVRPTHGPGTPNNTPPVQTPPQEPPALTTTRSLDQGAPLTNAQAAVVNKQRAIVAEKLTGQTEALVTIRALKTLRPCPRVGNFKFADYYGHFVAATLYSVPLGVGKALAEKKLAIILEDATSNRAEPRKPIVAG